MPVIIFDRMWGKVRMTGNHFWIILPAASKNSLAQPITVSAECAE